MSASKFFIILLIPIIILGLGIWFMSSLDVDRGNVKVAGAIVSAADVEVTVKKCYLEKSEGARDLMVELDAINAGAAETDIFPFLFKAVLSVKDKPISMGAPQSTFSPIYYESICETAPFSSTSIPSNAVRSLTLRFYGTNMPSGDEWDNYYLNLEYYDADNQLMLSKPLSPEGR